MTAGFAYKLIVLRQESSMSAATFFENAEAFRAWLEANSASATALLVGFHKVGSGRPSMSWSESVDEAICCRPEAK